MLKQRTHSDLDSNRGQTQLMEAKPQVLLICEASSWLKQCQQSALVLITCRLKKIVLSIRANVSSHRQKHIHPGNAILWKESYKLCELICVKQCFMEGFEFCLAMIYFLFYSRSWSIWIQRQHSHMI